MNASAAVPPKWLLLHIPFFILAYLLFLVAAASAVLFIIQERRIKHHQALAVTSRLPSLDWLEGVIYHCVLVSFPLLTAAMLLGSHWAVATGRRFWQWDPTETFSLITWIIYAIYLSLRIGRGWRGRRSTYLALSGFVIILFALIALFYNSPLHRWGAHV